MVMVLPSPLICSSPLIFNSKIPCSPHRTSATITTPLIWNCVKKQQPSSSDSSLDLESEITNGQSLQACRFCSCSGRRHFLEAAAVVATTATRLPLSPANACGPESDYMAILNEVHPPRPDWYEELYASVLNSGMKSYEAEIAAYKSPLFANLRGKVKEVLEVGIGTGPNLKYYASETDVRVFGVDPNRKMERYAQEAAAATGMPPANFKFIQAVGEAIPLSDASVDAVVGTLVLCSVKDVDQALQEVKRVLKPGGLYVFVEHVAAKDGTVLRFVQNVLDPLQQAVADGCHLTRKTGEYISQAGFSRVDLNMAFLSNASFINPHIYGIARK